MIVLVEHLIFRMRNSRLRGKLVSSSRTDGFYRLYTSTLRHNPSLAHIICAILIYKYRSLSSISYRLYAVLYEILVVISFCLFE